MKMGSTNLNSVERQAAAVLSLNAKELGLETKEVSFGKSNRTLSFIDESAKAFQLGWSIENATDVPVYILFGGLTGVLIALPGSVPASLPARFGLPVRHVARAWT